MFMDNEGISIWAETMSVEDLSAHFWLSEADEHPTRICDGEARPETPVPSDGPSFVCSACRDIYVADMVLGTRRFELLDRPPSTLRRTHADIKGTHAENLSEIIQARNDSQMTVPAITLASFADFYDTIRSKRAAMVRNLRDRHFSPDTYHHRDYYLQIRNCIGNSHWRSNQIHVFADAFGSLNFDSKQARKQKAAHDIADNYISHWNRQGESVFNVPTHVAGFEGLHLRFAPDIGVRTIHGDLLAAKLWFKYNKPNLPYRQAFHWLSYNLRPDNWDENVQPVIWDVRREEFLMPPPNMPKDI